MEKQTCILLLRLRERDKTVGMKCGASRQGDVSGIYRRNLMALPGEPRSQLGDANTVE